MKSRTSASLLLLTTFGLGGIAGAISHYLYVKQTAPAEQRRSYRPPSRDPLDELAQGLKLDAGQKEKLRVIFRQSREKYRELWQQNRPKEEAIRAETREAIRAILSEEQKVRFEEIIRSEDRHRSRDQRNPGSDNRK